MSGLIRSTVSAIIPLLLCSAVPVMAQPLGPRGMLGRPAFLDQLFRPELIMRQQQAIKLTTEQRDAITKTMASAQESLVNLRWQFEAASQELAEIVKPDRVDEAAALEKAKEVMDIEQQIKREHLLLLIRVKNGLTPEQQAKLRELQPMFRGRPGRGRPEPMTDPP